VYHTHKLTLYLHSFYELLLFVWFVFRELNEETGLQLNNILERQVNITCSYQSLEIIETDKHIPYLSLLDLDPDPGV